MNANPITAAMTDRRASGTAPAASSDACPAPAAENAARAATATAKAASTRGRRSRRAGLDCPEGQRRPSPRPRRPARPSQTAPAGAATGRRGTAGSAASPDRDVDEEDQPPGHRASAARPGPGRRKTRATPPIAHSATARARADRIGVGMADQRHRDGIITAAAAPCTNRAATSTPRPRRQAAATDASDEQRHAGPNARRARSGRTATRPTAAAPRTSACTRRPPTAARHPGRQVGADSPAAPRSR